MRDEEIKSYSILKNIHYNNMQKIYKYITTSGLLLSIIPAGVFFELYLNAASCTDFGCMDNIIILPLIIIGAIIIIPLAYYLGYRLQQKIKTKKINIILVIILIILAIFLEETTFTETGDLLRGLPFVRSSQKYDYETMKILDYKLNDIIGYFYWKNGRLPENIPEILNFTVSTKYFGQNVSDWNSYFKIYEEILSERRIEYIKNGNIEYTLCANFKTSRHKNDLEIFRVYNTFSMFKYHDKGDFCIKKTLDVIRDCSLCESEAENDIITTVAYHCYKSELDQFYNNNKYYPDSLTDQIFNKCEEPQVEAFKYIDCGNLPALSEDESIPKEKIYEKCETFRSADFKYTRYDNKYKLCTTFSSDNTVFPDDVMEYFKNDYLGITGYFEIEHKEGEYCFD